MRGLGIVATLCVCSEAFAQPADPPPPRVPEPYVFQGYPRRQLPPEDEAILARGPISKGRIVAGGVGAIFVGFGVGQAVEGRWLETGWIFTLGSVASLSVLLWGASDCSLGASGRHEGDTCSAGGEAKLLAGVIGVLGFHGYGIYDAFTGPADHNERFRELTRPMNGQWQLDGLRVTPTSDHHGAITGISISF